MTTAFYQRLIPRLFNAVCFGLVLIQTVTPVQSEEPVRLRILSWNIHHGEGVDGKLDLERIAGVIRGVKPDIVALQEVEVGSSRTNRVDQPAELARMTGLTSVFQQNIEFRGGGYGNALLSRLPVLSTNRLSLPNHDNGEQRGALSVQLRLPDRTDPLTFICTHLDHRSDDRERRDSAEAIEQYISGLPEGLMILAGDLNAVPESPVLDIFRRRWSIAGSQPLLTIPVDRPSQQIDFVLMRPEQRWRVTETRVLDEPIASDHRAIFVELQLR